jgi:putative NADPH-quinone reductase
MPRKILILQGHPDPAGGHLCHAFARAYAEGAREAGHGVEYIEIAHLDFPLLQTQFDYEHGKLPESLIHAGELLGWADHYVILFPIWAGTMPALLKGFLEQVMRPGIAFEYQEKAFPKKLLAGRSARLMVTMGMPAFIYRFFYLAHGVKGLERSILKFSGISPVRTSYFGGIGAVHNPKAAGWLDMVRRLGAEGI